MQALRDGLELRRKTEIHEIEEVCNFSVSLRRFKDRDFSFSSVKMVRSILS